MARPHFIPERGDVPATKVAALMGFDRVEDFNLALPDLLKRGFPAPDPTTGRWCIEAVDRWRKLRHQALFPELTQVSAASDARAVLAARRQAHG